MNYQDDSTLDALFELYASEDDVEAAAREKEAGEEVFVDVGETVKDYPNSQREIDLHGHTGQEAMFELTHFIEQAIQHRVRTVRVVTGKGLHSKHMKSVLPELTERKLGEFRRARKVLTFRREKAGGAYVVYLIS